MWKMYVTGSGTSHRSARPGATFKSFPRESKSSKIRLSMRSDCASIPTRGSRLVGLDSMIMTSVFGSGLNEQERSGKSSARRKITRSGESATWGRRKPEAGSPKPQSRIRDLPQHRRPFRPRRRRHIRRPPVPSLVGKHRKRHSLFRLRRDSKLVGESNANAARCSPFGNHLHQGAVFRAAARENQFLKTRRSWDSPDHETFDGIANGASGDGGCGRDNVFLARPSAPSQKLSHKLPPELLTPGGLRRFGAKERLPEDPFHNRLDYVSGCCNPSPAIKTLSEQLMRDGVDDHVPRPSIESLHAVGVRAWRNGCKVGNPTNVLHDPSNPRVPKPKVVEIRNQWSALSARGHVGRTEVGNDGHSHARRDDGAFSRLPCRSDLASEKGLWFALMVDRLSVTADQVGGHTESP